LGSIYTNEAKKLTNLSCVFLEPTNATHRQYEAFRAFFVEGLPSAEVARRFGYSPGSFRVLVHQFRQNPRRDFFLTPAKGPQSAPKTDPLHDRIIALRKENLSIYDISRNLAHQGHTLSPAAIA
jgi:transposase-like protein